MKGSVTESGSAVTCAVRVRESLVLPELRGIQRPKVRLAISSTMSGHHETGGTTRIDMEPS